VRERRKQERGRDVDKERGEGGRDER
jgi:hypothetical protein